MTYHELVRAACIGSGLGVEASTRCVQRLTRIFEKQFPRFSMDAEVESPEGLTDRQMQQQLAECFVVWNREELSKS